MRSLSSKFTFWKSLFGAGVLGLTATVAQAQPMPSALPPTAVVAGPTTAAPTAATPSPTYSLPCPGYMPTPGSIPNAVMGLDQQGAGAGMGAGTGADSGAFRSVTSGAGFSNNTAVGYIDSAIPFTQVRVRYDAMYGNNRPDHAEFFYPKCGCFRVAGLDPDAKGPPLPETNIDAQELSASLEYAPIDRFSMFVDVPVRFINPDVNANETGLSNINFGAKYAVIMDPCQVLTGQLRVFTPTGDGFKGLGNEQWATEVGVLYYRQLSDRLFFEAELRDWIPLTDRTDFEGNVLRYGVGLSYRAYNGPSFRVTPVGEVVGWTVLGGKYSDELGAVNGAWGDTIVNLKMGARLGFGDINAPGMLNQSDLYVGYGRALTGEVWYQDVVRVELRLRF